MKFSTRQRYTCHVSLVSMIVRTQEHKYSSSYNRHCRCPGKCPGRQLVAAWVACHTTRTCSSCVTRGALCAHSKVHTPFLRPDLQFLEIFRRVYSPVHCELARTASFSHEPVRYPHREGLQDKPTQGCARQVTRTRLRRVGLRQGSSEALDGRKTPPVTTVSAPSLRKELQHLFPVRFKVVKPSGHQKPE